MDVGYDEKGSRSSAVGVERMTRLELATSTVGRVSRSTGEKSWSG
jgi:hypothetical protein